MTENSSLPGNGRFRTRVGLVIALLGFFIFLIGADPGLFGLDRSPVVGFVQIGVFLIGLAVICMGGYICMNGLWNGVAKPIVADIGLRLVSTGFVIAFAAGMADVFGFGSQLSPQIPYYGPYQEIGVLVGEAVIALGFILQIPFGIHRRKDEQSPEQIPEEGHQHLNVILE